MRRTETPDPGWFDEVAGHFLFKTIEGQRKIYFSCNIEVVSVLAHLRAVYNVRNVFKLFTKSFFLVFMGVKSNWRSKKIS